MEWHPEEKAWSVPISRQNIETLDLLGSELSDELANIRQSFVSENTADENTFLPAPLKVSPYEHQLKGYNLACRSMGIIGNNGVAPGFALLMEMGTGKTITSIAIFGKAYLTGKIKRLLILAPKSIVAVWEDEFSKFADFPYSLSVLTGTSQNKTKLLKAIRYSGLEVVVVNYDSVPLIEKELAAWHPDFLICDESSKIKNPTAKMSKAAYRIAKVCKYRLILTGTPIQNNPLDFFRNIRSWTTAYSVKAFMPLRMNMRYSARTISRLVGANCRSL